MGRKIRGAPLTDRRHHATGGGDRLPGQDSGSDDEERMAVVGAEVSKVLVVELLVQGIADEALVSKGAAPTQII